MRISLTIEFAVLKCASFLSRGRSTCISIFVIVFFSNHEKFNISLLQIKQQWDWTKSYHNLWTVLSLKPRKLVSSKYS